MRGIAVNSMEYEIDAGETYDKNPTVMACLVTLWFRAQRDELGCEPTLALISLSSALLSLGEGAAKFGIRAAFKMRWLERHKFETVPTTSGLSLPHPFSGTSGSARHFQERYPGTFSLLEPRNQAIAEFLLCMVRNDDCLPVSDRGQMH